MHTPSRICFCILSVLMALSSCKENVSTAEDHLGEIKFDATGKAEAKPVFTRGMLLLHSFEYADAAEAFQEVRKIDPDFVMAYWGEAMTHNHPLWQEQDYDTGNEILNALAPTPEDRIAKAKTRPTLYSKIIWVR